jgi:hypothetical protein
VAAPVFDPLEAAVGVFFEKHVRLSLAGFGSMVWPGSYYAAITHGWRGGYAVSEHPLLSNYRFGLGFGPRFVLEPVTGEGGLLSH